MNTPITLGPQAQCTITQMATGVAPGTVFSSNNMWIASPSRRWVLIFQTDGNLVLYRIVNAPENLEEKITLNGRWVWTTNTDNNPNSSFEVQTDGNLVIYSADRKVLWNSTTRIPSVGLYLQDDGNLTLRKSIPAWHYLFTARDQERFDALRGSGFIEVPLGPEAHHTTTDSSNMVAPGTTFTSNDMWLASPNKHRVLVFQKDGNLVLYARDANDPNFGSASFSGTPIWDAESSRNQKQTFAVQTDGNLVVYDDNGKDVWSSNTAGTIPIGLSLQDDNNLVLYQAVPIGSLRTVGSAIWMENMWESIGQRPLREIVLPGSHDAGMSTFSKDFGGNDCNTRTQQLKIGDQLVHGCRQFDLRLATWHGDNKWYLAHGSAWHTGFIGGFGEVLDDALRDVRDFAKSHVLELIILRFSHYMNVDGLNVKEFTYEQLVKLRDKVKTLLGDVMIKSSDYFIRLAESMPDELISGERTVLCMFEDMQWVADPTDGIFSGGCNFDRFWQRARFAPSMAAGNDGQYSFAYVTDRISDNHMLAGGSHSTGYDKYRTYYMENRSKTGIGLAIGPDGTHYALFVASNAADDLLLTKSRDGKLWSDTTGTGQKTSSDPCLTVGKDGTLYAAYLGTNNKIVITVSKNGGKNWSTNDVVSKQKTTYFSSKPPALAVDANNKLYLLCVGNNPSNRLVMGTSEDGGKTWSEPVEPDTQGRGLQASKAKPSLVIDDNGYLYALYVTNDASNEVYLIKSMSGGERWIVSPTGKRSSMGLSLAIDSAGTLYSLYADQIADNFLRLIRSQDGGLTWDSPDHYLTTPSNLDCRGSYANNKDSSVVIEDQTKKYDEFSPQKGLLIEISWTATRPDPPADFGVPCIKDLAAALAPKLDKTMQDWTKPSSGKITREKRPNVIWLDYYDDQYVRVFEFLNGVNR